MTGFDIFSAIGSVGDDLLEESEETEKGFAASSGFSPAVFKKIKNFSTSHVPMLAAAACFAFLALGLRHIYRDISIEQPVPDDGLSSITSYTSAPNFSEIIESESTSTSRVTASETYTESAAVTEEYTTAETAVTKQETQTEIPEVYSETTVTKNTKITETAVRKNSKTTTAAETTEEETQEPFITETEFTDTEENIFIPYFPWVTVLPESETTFRPKPPVTESVTAVTGSDSSSNEGDDEAIDSDDESIDDDDDSDLTTVYNLLDYGGNTYMIMWESFKASELTFLGEGEVYRIDKNGNRVVKPCEIYKINGRSEKYMLAVLTDDGNYVGFWNGSYKPNSLSEYVADINFLNQNDFALVRAESADGSGYYEYTLPDLRQALERLILAVPDAALTSNSIPYAPQGLKRYFVEDSGRNPLAIIYGHGYIAISGMTFYIGEEYAAAFVSYIESNVEKSEFFPYAPDRNDDVIDDVEIND